MPVSAEPHRHHWTHAPACVKDRLPTKPTLPVPSHFAAGHYRSSSLKFPPAARFSVHRRVVRYWLSSPLVCAISSRRRRPHLSGCTA
ncbi:hypothetical protein TorRG33x02_200240 [Trema orientale]|uniref:Uncharacterized protein n=1 Tax=Trema orientale TaxID=63057 RepID=A0A2P5EF31_TREOI|nr:hypothetical protein TorRG33x02_200240 [Trema orientale]